MKRPAYALLILFTLLCTSPISVFAQEGAEQVSPKSETQDTTPNKPFKDNVHDLADNLVQEYQQVARELELKNQECQDVEKQIKQSELAYGFGNPRIQSQYTLLSTCRNEKSVLDLKLTLLKTQGQQTPGFLSKLQTLQGK
jgi:hypothetical protein